MRLTLTSNDGEVIATIEDIEQYDLDKPMAVSDVINEIQTNVKWGKEHGKI